MEFEALIVKFSRFPSTLLDEIRHEAGLLPPDKSTVDQAGAKIKAKCFGPVHLMLLPLTMLEYYKRSSRKATIWPQIFQSKNYDTDTKTEREKNDHGGEGEGL